MAVTRPFSPAAPFRVHPKPVPKAAPPAPGWTRPACRPWHGPPTFRRRLSARSDRPVPADRNTGQHVDRRAAVGPAAAGRRPALRRRSGHNRPKRASARPAADGPKTERNTYECQFFAETGGLTHESDRHRIDLAGLLTRSRPDAFPTPRGSVAEDIRNVTEHHSSGTVRDLHPIPFSFRPPQEERNTRSGDKDSGFPRKRQKTGKLFSLCAPIPAETTNFAI